MANTESIFHLLLMPTTFEQDCMALIHNTTLNFLTWQGLLLGKKSILGSYIFSLLVHSSWAKTSMWDSAPVSAVSLTVPSVLTWMDGDSWDTAWRRRPHSLTSDWLTRCCWPAMDGVTSAERAWWEKTPWQRSPWRPYNRRLWVPGGWKWPHPNQTPPGSLCSLSAARRCSHPEQVSVPNWSITCQLN